jgi:hypothetical protein
LRRPDPTEAVFGQFSQTLDVGRGNGEVYPDEIDPEWADPTTAEWRRPERDD